MEYVLFKMSFIAVVFGAVQPNKQTYVIEASGLSDLVSDNCNSVIEIGSCAAECGLNQCYRTSSRIETTFPQDGFCAVFNVSQELTAGTDRYTVSGRICMSSSSHPHGTGLLFNYHSQNDYEVLYKTSQDSSDCFIGFVVNGVLRQTDSFECGITTANQWHRYTVTVYNDKTFEASLSTQAGNSASSGRLNTTYPMSTRGGALIINDGSPGKILQFDEVSAELVGINECASSPCGPVGICVDGPASYTCYCYTGYTGVHCETNINECASSPCGSGGSCVDGVASYVCNCYPGYTGIKCETNINECASSPCSSGGSCVDGSGSYTCNCFDGYTGVRCETAILTGLYFIEQGSPGYITSLTPDGVQTRESASGGTTEHNLAVDSQANLLFYTCHVSPDFGVWRADLDDISATQRQISTHNNDAWGLGISTTDRLVFVDQSSSGIVMLNYEGTLLDTLSVSTKSTAWGLAADETRRILYFTENVNDRLSKVSFSSTNFVGSATVILQGTEVGNAPYGLVFENDILYWILVNTGEIRSMPVTGSTSTIVVPAADTSGYNSYCLTKKGQYFYHTRSVGDGGVYRVAAGGTREKITTSTTLFTQGIDVY